MSFQLLFCFLYIRFCLISLMSTNMALSGFVASSIPGFLHDCHEVMYELAYSVSGS